MAKRQHARPGELAPRTKKVIQALKKGHDAEAVKRIAKQFKLSTDYISLVRREHADEIGYKLAHRGKSKRTKPRTVTLDIQEAGGSAPRKSRKRSAPAPEAALHTMAVKVLHNAINQLHETERPLCRAALDLVTKGTA